MFPADAPRRSPHFEVEVWAGGFAFVADASDELPGLHPVAFADEDVCVAHVPVDEVLSAGGLRVLPDPVSESGDTAGCPVAAFDDGAVCDCVDRCASGRCVVLAVVVGAPAWAVAGAEGACPFG